jgi:ribosomal protein L24
VSNVQLIDPDTKKPARAGFRYEDDGTQVRISRPGGKDF